MDTEAGRKLGITVSDGGQAHVRRTHADVELDRALRALFYAMEGKGKNLRNAAEGITHPARMLVRRLREAKAARRDRTNYPLAKRTVAELDRYVDRLYGKDSIYTTGDHPRAA